MNNKRLMLIAFALVIGLQLAVVDSAVACPTCKQGLADGMALGYAISIVLMMGVPAVIFTFWMVVIARLRAKAAAMTPSDWQAIQG